MSIPCCLSGEFDDLIHTYAMRQSQEDQATVTICYQPRQIKLNLNMKDVDAEPGEFCMQRY